MIRFFLGIVMLVAAISLRLQFPEVIVQNYPGRTMGMAFVGFVLAVWGISCDVMKRRKDKKDREFEELKRSWN